MGKKKLSEIFPDQNKNPEAEKSVEESVPMENAKKEWSPSRTIFKYFFYRKK